MTLKVVALLHASVLVSDVQRSLDFYQQLLGFELDDGRPELGYPGAWLKAGDQQIHLLQLPNPDPVERPQHGGHDRHIALRINSSEQLRDRLDSHSVPYTTSQSRPHVLFIRDPDGNALEFIGYED